MPSTNDPGGNALAASWTNVGRGVAYQQLNAGPGS
jgi:hypothetical protein